MVEEDFNDWGKFIDLFYSDFKDRRLAAVKKNHIFSCCDSLSWRGHQFMVRERESDLLEHTVVEMKAIKTGFYERFGFKDGRYNLVDYLYDKKKKLKDAIAAQPCIIRAAMSDQLQQIEAPGINIYKQVEMYTKYLPIVPEEHWGDELYVKPSDEIIEATKDKSRRR